MKKKSNKILLIEALIKSWFHIIIVDEFKKLVHSMERRYKAIIKVTQLNVYWHCQIFFHTVKNINVTLHQKAWQLSYHQKGCKEPLLVNRCNKTPTINCCIEKLLLVATQLPFFFCKIRPLLVWCILYISRVFEEKIY